MSKPIGRGPVRRVAAAIGWSTTRSVSTIFEPAIAKAAGLDPASYTGGSGAAGANYQELVTGLGGGGVGGGYAGFNDQ